MSAAYHNPACVRVYAHRTVIILLR